MPCERCGEEKVIGKGNKYCLECKKLCPKCNNLRELENNYCHPCANETNLIARRRHKEEVITHYGGVCVCCGEKHIEFLTLDHIIPLAKLKETRIKGSVYSALKARGYPDNLQVMCFNCNMAKDINAVCPHQNFKTVEYMI